MITQRSPGELSQHQPRIIDEIDEAIDRGEVLRYLGYPVGVSPDDQIQGILDHWIETADKLATPRAIYVVLPVVEKDRKQLYLQANGGITQFYGAIGEFLGAAHHVAVFIATAGPEVESLASKLMDERNDLAAMIVNAVGAERAEAAEAVVIDELREQAAPSGDAPTMPYSPGYCGMSLTEQTTLFGLFDRENIGVSLSPSCLMRPLKSVSGLIGLGPAEEIETFGSPCDRCELQNCAMRR